MLDMILDGEEMQAQEAIDNYKTNVRLVSHSVPTEQFEAAGLQTAEDLVAFCARVSNPSNQYNTATADKLIKYLIDHKHWSPLEMASACVEITTTRDIARQILRHRSFAFQEFSQRYADPTKDLDFVMREARLQDHKNRQNSVELDYTNDDQRQVAYQWENLQRDLIEQTKKMYAWAIEKGIAKEQARAILPEGLTLSRMYMNGTLRSWIHYIELRSAEGTQKEHREIARQCAYALSTVFPLINTVVH